MRFSAPRTPLSDDRIWNEVNPASPADLRTLSDTGITLCTGTVA
ncbi:hypothetical protein OG462_37405 [Streptomyces sp. NBC_01077]|nr:hypothetical protein OG462_37405 [Streptomyces sp. NBC_01077]